MRLREGIFATDRLGSGSGLVMRRRIDGAHWELLYLKVRVCCLPDITHRDGSSLRSGTMLVDAGAEARQ